MGKGIPRHYFSRWYFLPHGMPPESWQRPSPRHCCEASEPRSLPDMPHLCRSAKWGGSRMTGFCDLRTASIDFVHMADTGLIYLSIAKCYRACLRPAAINMVVYY